MDEFERRLATMLHEVVPEPLHEIDESTIADGKPRRRRAAILAPIAAAAVVLGVAAIAVLPRRSDVRRPHATTSSPGATPPPATPTPSALYGTRWTLTSIRGVSGAPAPVVFRFAPDGGITAGTCDTARVRGHDQSWTFVQTFIDNLKTNCGPRLDVDQSHYVFSRVLAGTVRWQIDEMALTITHPGVGSLVLTATDADWKSWRGPHLTIRFPAAWHATPFRGAPATVFFPIVYLSEQPIGGTCELPDTTLSTTCFNGSWPVHDDGVIVRWGLSALPNQGVSSQPGRQMTIDGRRARVADKTGEIDAAIALSTDPRYEEYISMQATLGAHVSDADRAGVHTMLETVRIRPNG